MPAHTNYRVIVRFSLDHDGNSGVRNGVIAKLQSAGLQNTRTGAWETPSGNIVDVSMQLNAVLDDIAKLSSDPDHTMTLDHIWIYIDKA